MFSYAATISKIGELIRGTLKYAVYLNLLYGIVDIWFSAHLIYHGVRKGKIKYIYKTTLYWLAS